LDPLVKDFFQNTFPGFHSDVVVENDVLLTNVPVVSLPLDIDVGELLDLVKTIPLDFVKRKIYPYEQFPRIQEWYQKALWSNGNVSPIMDDVYYKKSCSPFEAVLPDNKSNQIKEILSNLGISIDLCMISVIGANGYIRPHRDINLIKHPLAYFWLPLNNPLGNELKIYPYGTVDVQLGNLYLLNQKNFVHSVINTGNETRYVLIGWINDISDELQKLVKQSIISSYNT